MMAGLSEVECQTGRKESSVVCKPDTDVEAAAEIQEMGFKGTKEHQGLRFLDGAFM